MTNRSPNAVRSLVAVRRLARGLRGVGLAAAWLAGVGAAGAVVAMREAYPRAPQAGPAQGWPPATPVPEGRLAVALVLGASGSVTTDALGSYEVFARSPTFSVDTVSASRPTAMLSGGLAVGPDDWVEHWWPAAQPPQVDWVRGQRYIQDGTLTTTARVTARSIHYPTEQLEPAGAAWPWRPTALFALTVAAATGVALLPAAATRRNRR